MKCTRTNCNNETEQGDILFCSSHREDWRNNCETNHLNDASNYAVAYFLKQYQKGNI